MIPDDWEEVTLADCITSAPQYGANSSALEYRPELPRYVRITDVTEIGTLDESKRASIQLEGNETYLLEEDDFLFARSGATVGKTYLYQSKVGQAIFAGYLIRFKLNQSLLLPGYLKQYTQTQQYWDWVHNMMRQGAQPNINAQEYSSLFIPLPSIGEQKRIVEILEDWDRAIAATKSLIALKQQREQWLKYQLLSKKLRYPEFLEQPWSPVKLSEILTQNLRKVSKPSISYKSLGIRSHGKGTFVKDEVDPEDIALHELFEVKQGDLILNITFAWEGAIAIAKEQDEGCLVSHRFPTYEFQTEWIDAEFFGYLMVTKEFIYKLGLISPGGAGRNRVLNKGDFLKLEVTLPSIDEQKRIVQALSFCDYEILLLEKKLAAFKQQKNGVLQRLITGRVRVKP